MGGLEKFALQHTEPDLDLIQPGGVSGQPVQLHHQLSLRCPRQFLNPLWELLGRVGRTIIQDQSNRLDTTILSLGNNDGL